MKLVKVMAIIRIITEIVYDENQCYYDDALARLFDLKSEIVNFGIVNFCIEHCYANLPCLPEQTWQDPD